MGERSPTCRSTKGLRPLAPQHATIAFYDSIVLASVSNPGRRVRRSSRHRLMQQRFRACRYEPSIGETNGRRGPLRHVRTRPFAVSSRDERTHLLSRVCGLKSSRLEEVPRLRRCPSSRGSRRRIGRIFEGCCGGRGLADRGPRCTVAPGRRLPTLPDRQSRIGNVLLALPEGARRDQRSRARPSSDRARVLGIGVTCRGDVIDRPGSRQQAHSHDGVRCGARPRQLARHPHRRSDHLRFERRRHGARGSRRPDRFIESVPRAIDLGSPARIA